MALIPHILPLPIKPSYAPNENTWGKKAMFASKQQGIVNERSETITPN